MKTVNITGVPFSVSQICLGTAFFGNDKYVPKDRSFELLDYYYQHDGRFFNTAHEYGHGKSELCLGEWFKSRGMSRDSFIITTKGGEDTTKPPKYTAMHREDLIEDIDESLQRLQLDYVDFYMLHLDDPDVSDPVNKLSRFIFSSFLRSIILFKKHSYFTSTSGGLQRIYADQ